MKRFLAIFSGFALLTFNTSAQKLELTANIPGSPNDAIVRLYNLVDNSVDSTYVKNHSFSFSKTMHEGGSMYILMVGDANAEELEKSQLGTVIVLEPGKVIITGKGHGFKDAEISGGPAAVEWQGMQKFVMGIEQKLTDLTAIRVNKTEVMQVGDQDVSDQLNIQESKLINDIKLEGKAWLDQNLSSPFAAYVLNPLMTSVFNKDEHQGYLKKLKGDALNNQIAKKLISDMQGSPSKIGQMAPDFSMSDEKGEKVSLSDFRGKYVLLDFWASWCAPCRKAIPQLKALYEKHKNKNFTVVNVSLDNNKEKWMTALNEEKLPWINLSDLKGAESPVASLYSVKAIPHNLLIDPSGKIIALGAFGSEETNIALDKKLSTLLK